jgi:hypothetical protein
MVITSTSMPPLAQGNPADEHSLSLAESRGHLIDAIDFSSF